MKAKEELTVAREFTYNLVDSGNLGLQDGDGITNGRLHGVFLSGSSDG
jgi:hypothetical protein|tara:strand:+ start:494 stop:637 length:144 start_codon:yes stop_codon:yes gene_type:complete